MVNIKSILFSKTAKNTGITLLGNVANAAVVMILTIVVSRFLGPEKFGLFSVALTLYLAGFDLFGLGIEQGVVRFVSHHEGKEEPQESLKFIKVAFVIRIITSVVLFLMAFIVAEPLAVNVFNNPKLITPFMIVLIGQSGALLMSLVISVLQAYQKFITTSLLYTLTGAVRLILTIYFLLTQTASIENLLAVFVMAPFLSFLLGMLVLPKDFVKSKPSIEIFKNLIHYSKWILLWAITVTIHTKIDIFMIARFLGDYQTGIYSAATRLTLGIVWINSSISTVLTPKYSRVRSNDQLSALIKKGYFGIFIFVTGIIISIIFGSFIIPLIFGIAYKESVLPFQIVMTGMIFFMLSTPPMAALTALGKSKVIGLISLCQVPIVFLGNFFLIPLFGITGSAITSLTSNCFVFIVSALIVRSAIKRKT